MDNFGNSNKCAALGLQMRDGNTQMETAIRGDAAGQGQIGLIPERKPVPGWLIGLEVLTAICIATLTAGFIWPDCPPPRCIDADVECSAYLSECFYTCGSDASNCECVDSLDERKACNTDSVRVIPKVIGGIGVVFFYLIKTFMVKNYLSTMTYLRSLNSTTAGVHNSEISPEEEQLHYVDAIKTVTQNVFIHVRASHTETRTRTVHYTDSKGKSHSKTESYTVTVTTFSHDYDFGDNFLTIDQTPFSSLDIRTMIDMHTGYDRSMYVEFDSSISNAYSESANLFLSYWEKHLNQINLHRDKSVHAYRMLKPSQEIRKEHLVRYGQKDPFMTESRLWIYFIFNCLSLYVSTQALVCSSLLV